MTIMKNKSTQELFGATSEGLSAKSSYATPTIKVVTFQVEKGFDGTGDYKTGQWHRNSEDQIVIDRQGLQDFERETQNWTIQ